jgi:hypothetical protein
MTTHLLPVRHNRPTNASAGLIHHWLDDLALSVWVLVNMRA